MLTTLRNEAITLTTSDRGGEWMSLESAQGLSYLWNGDPAHWSYRAPTLFPIIGAIRDGRAQADGGPIRLNRHGFCRTAVLELETASETAVTYRLQDTEETRAGYPYAFVLRITHTLAGATVTTQYRVTNTGDRPLPFFVGGHPAFRVPLLAEETLEDYAVTFAQPETADCPQLDPASGLVRDDVRNRLLTDADTFSLNHVLFRGDALVFDRLRSRRVRLHSRKSGHGVQMDFDGMDYFAIWSPTVDAPFVCLEPWTGTATQVSEDDVFEHKQGVTILRPGDEARFAFSVTVF